MPERTGKLKKTTDYSLADQVGYKLRRVTQRHMTIFASHIPALTPTQFAAIAKLYELGPVSQNELGRQTSMDSATIKGVVDRLRKRSLVETRRDTDDQRRLFVEISDDGHLLYEQNIEAARKISAETLDSLSKKEQKTFLELLAKLT